MGADVEVLSCSAQSLPQLSTPPIIHVKSPGGAESSFSTVGKGGCWPLQTGWDQGKGSLACLGSLCSEGRWSTCCCCYCANSIGSGSRSPAGSLRATRDFGLGPFLPMCYWAQRSTCCCKCFPGWQAAPFHPPLAPQIHCWVRASVCLVKTPRRDFGTPS